jgi:hypothetical protein
LGEVFKSEDIHRKRKKIPDLSPKPFPEPVAPSSFDDLVHEVRELRVEVEKIKKALKARGIPV